MVTSPRRSSVSSWNSVFLSATVACLSAAACTAIEASPTASRTSALTTADGGTGTPLQQLQTNYVDLRFGMFLHFGILTYTGKWAQANLDINRAPSRRLRALAERGEHLQRRPYLLA
jgi:hypothetical protein